MKSIITQKKIKVVKKTTDKICSFLPKPVIYKSQNYRISTTATGKNVKIALIDSGCPIHKDIRIQGESTSFCKNNKNTTDKTGHATMMAGIINANNKKSIIGLAPHAKLYCAKVVDEENNCSFNALLAAVLWSIAKKVDIIVLALGTQFDYTIFHDAVKKAYDENICIFAAAGNSLNGTVNCIDFPAQYPQVCSVGNMKKTGKIKIKEKVNIPLDYKKYYTTYLNNKYIQMSGSSAATAIVASLAALIIEKKKSNPKTVYSELLKTIN